LTPPRKEFCLTVLSLSTMWGVGRFDSLAPFASTAEELAFSHLELNYAPTPEMVNELLHIHHLPISSIHVPCPWGTFKDTPAHRLLLNSTDAEERDAALGFAHRTIELASRLGAPYVIVHAGAVAPAFPVETELRNLYRQNGKDDERFHQVRQRLRAVREKEREPYLHLAYESLVKLARHGASCGVKLALENRYYYSEVPSLEEMETFLADLGPSVAGYWHDVGHAENQARLGFTPHREWLERLGPRMLGVHLHDINALSDHHAPGKGSMDWPLIAQHLPREAFRVLELNKANERNEIQAALTLLRKEGII